MCPVYNGSFRPFSSNKFLCFFKWNCRSESSKTPVQSAEKKNKKKKKSNEEAKEENKAISSRTYPNGLVVEEIKMGKPDGRKATPGKQVYLIIMIYMIYYVVTAFPDFQSSSYRL